MGDVGADGSDAAQRIDRLVSAGRSLLAKLVVDDRAGRLGDGAVELVAIGWATVDLDRASIELDQLLGVGPPGPSSEDSALGARCVAVPLGASGVLLVYLEPVREGPLAAFLARHGEGLAAVYAGPPQPSRGDTPGAGRSQPPCAARRVAGERDGPFLMVVGDTWAR